MFQKYSLHLLFFSVGQFCHIFCYNIDTNYPIIYKDPFPNATRNYFGYAVLLGNEWIQIGSPGAAPSERRDYATGVAHFCKFKHPCVEISLGEHITKKRFTLSKKSWFGSSMDLVHDKQIVVCAHRWMNESYENVIPGACISFQTNQNPRNVSTIIAPTASTRRDMRMIYSGSKPIAYRYAQSQAGTSIHQRKDTGILLLGAPGSINWRGTIISCKDVATCTSRPTILDTHLSTYVKDYELFGYSVSSGRFFSSDVYYVAGAPRDTSYMRGYVMVFQVDAKNKFESPPKIITGDFTGEYFGSCVAVADINRNGLDDLIVGAPFFSRKGDEGRICVIQFFKDTSYKKTCIEGKAENGRFGSSLAAIGDVNKDNYQDIAVGAPYEGNGAIYIYFGRFDGFKRYQRIVAEEIYNDLKGFGISISGQTDVDGNKYTDLAVGSYLSGHVVILRSRPVIKITAHFDSTVGQLLPNETQVTITSCVEYSGPNAPPHLNISRKISGDLSNKRVHPSYIEDTLNLKVGEKRCTPHFFKVSFKSASIHQNLVFLLESQIANFKITAQKLLVQNNGAIKGKDYFSHQNPVEEQEEVSSYDSIEIPFAHDCKKPVCEPDLKLTCTFLENNEQFRINQSFIVGSTAKYQLKIDVTNPGEPSYLSNAEIKFPHGVHLSHVPHTCTERKEGPICQLGLIARNGSKTLLLDLDMLEIENIIIMDEHKIEFHVYISTNAEDINQHNNVEIISLNVKFDINGYIHGKSQEDIYPVIKLENGSFASVLEIVHIHEVYKKGISFLKDMALSLQIPIEIQHKNKNIQFALLQTYEAVIDNGYWSCSTNEYGHADSSQSIEFEDSDSSSTHTRLRRSVLENDLLDEKSPPSNRTLYINCSMNHVKCITLICQSTELQSYGKVMLKISVNVGNLEPVLGQRDIVFLTTAGNITIFNPHITNKNNIQQKWPHASQASSIIIGKIPKKKIELWVLVSSVVGGILLVMFVAMGLAKAGFFQRKKKAELQELKQEARNSQSQPESKTVEEEENTEDAFELN